jgi:uncharacterized coiled-coil protein SlyX
VAKDKVKELNTKYSRQMVKAEKTRKKLDKMQQKATGANSSLSDTTSS